MWSEIGMSCSAKKYKNYTSMVASVQARWTTQKLQTLVIPIFTITFLNNSWARGRHLTLSAWTAIQRAAYLYPTSIASDAISATIKKSSIAKLALKICFKGGSYVILTCLVYYSYLWKKFQNFLFCEIAHHLCEFTVSSSVQYLFL